MAGLNSKVSVTGKVLVNKLEDKGSWFSGPFIIGVEGENGITNEIFIDVRHPYSPEDVEKVLDILPGEIVTLSGTVSTSYYINKEGKEAEFTKYSGFVNYPKEGWTVTPRAKISGEAILGNIVSKDGVVTSALLTGSSYVKAKGTLNEEEVQYFGKLPVEFAEKGVSGNSLAKLVEEHLKAGDAIKFSANIISYKTEIEQEDAGDDVWGFVDSSTPQYVWTKKVVVDNLKPVNSFTKKEIKGFIDENKVKKAEMLEKSREKFFAKQPTVTLVADVEDEDFDFAD
jgi:hypothetical protein